MSVEEIEFVFVELKVEKFWTPSKIPDLIYTLNSIKYYRSDFDLVQQCDRSLLAS